MSDWFHGKRDKDVMVFGVNVSTIVSSYALLEGQAWP